MFEGVPDEGAQVDGTIGHGDGMTSDGVGHVQLQGDKVEAVDVFPVIVPADDFAVVPEIEDGVEPELVVKVKRLGLNLGKAIRITHKTDKFD